MDPWVLQFLSHLDEIELRLLVGPLSIEKDVSIMTWKELEQEYNDVPLERP